MANTNMLRNSCNNSKNTKVCSINIGGLSSKARFQLDKYVNDENVGILAVQENGPHEIDKMQLTNMKIIQDTNKSKNRGALLYIHQSIPYVILSEISKKSTELDSVWALVVLNKKRIIIGSIYVKHHYTNAIKDALSLLNSAYTMRNKLKAQGVILTGDFNARHPAWGDSVTTDKGKQLFDQLDFTKFKILTSDSPTYLCVDGSSHIDLMIASNSISDIISPCYTDDIVELSSGAPFRGHVPLLTSILEPTTRSNEVKVKLDVEETKWHEWSEELENSITHDDINIWNTDDPNVLWEYLTNKIEMANQKHCKLKKVTCHSKPYWTPQLTVLCNRMRKARRLYMARNTDSRKQEMIDSKQLFDDERKRACDEFILEKTKSLNTADALKFWKRFNRLFKKKVDQGVDPLFNEDGSILTDIQDIETRLFSTFFESKHISSGNFDDVFYNTVNAMYEDIENNNFNMDNQNDIQKKLNGKITLKEIKWAIKRTKCGNKSTDNFNVHPRMLHNFGQRTLNLLQKLFNSCLDHGKWVWNTAKVIFLKKGGKTSYAEPGAYRPISISSYIGKLLEKILAARITLFLEAHGIFDPNQEGFTPNRNTIRYLNRLNLEVKSDLLNNDTVIGLFIDFEKAFDSVWKKGLICKMFNLNINGKVLKVIDSFLHSRKVQLDINGNVGAMRDCNEYGLPQGSALSPLLFKIYILDILEEFNAEDNIRIYKFADDGTVKVRGKTTAECVESLNKVLGSIEKWTKMWRMVVNCDANKTEYILFRSITEDTQEVPNSVSFGNKSIKRVTQTKVLGLIIDEKLSYIPHSKKANQKICGSWANMCEFTNRNYGFNQRVICQITRTYFLPSLHYAGLVWQNNRSIKEVEGVWYRIIKSAIGAVFNIRKSLAEVILGLPPLDLQNKMNQIKHYLKMNIKPSAVDHLRDFIQGCFSNMFTTPPQLIGAMKDIFKFLQWKIQNKPSDFNENDIRIIESLDYSEFFNLSSKSCSYTKTNISKYVETLWYRKLRNEFMTEGQHIPKPSCCNLPIPQNTTRKQEVILMSLMYPNNLFNDFVWRHTYQIPSPLCQKCHQTEETPYHVILQCSARANQARQMLSEILSEEEIAQEDCITILNGSRHQKFIKLCLETIAEGNYREEIILDETV